MRSAGVYPEAVYPEAVYPAGAGPAGVGSAGVCLAGVCLAGDCPEADGLAECPTGLDAFTLPLPSGLAWQPILSPAFDN